MTNTQLTAIIKSLIADAEHYNQLAKDCRNAEQIYSIYMTSAQILASLSGALIKAQAAERIKDHEPTG